MNFKGKWHVDRIVFILAIILLAGCSADKRPAGVLSEEEMVQVLKELYLAEERITKLYLPVDSVTKITPLFRERVFQKTGIADSVYKRSMEYYMARPKKLEFIYTALIDTLNLMEQSYRPESGSYAQPQ